MTLKEAIKHSENLGKCSLNREHQQLAAWLRELQAARKELNHIRQTALAGVMSVAALKVKQRPVVKPKFLKDVRLGTVFGQTPMEGDL